MGNVMYLPERVSGWYTDLYSDIYGNRLELIMHHKIAFMINLFYPIKQERSFKHEFYFDRTDNILVQEIDLKISNWLTLQRLLR